MTIRIDRVVTRGGDLGLTGLGNGTGSARIVHGSKPTAPSTRRMPRSACCARRCRPGASAERFLCRVQSMLFDVGADLCVPGEAGASLRLGDGPVDAVEAAIAGLLEQQTPLDSFVLPAGSPAAAHAHVARTIMRRAERRVVTLAAAEPVTPSVIRLLNTAVGLPVRARPPLERRWSHGRALGAWRLNPAASTRQGCVRGAVRGCREAGRSRRSRSGPVWAIFRCARRRRGFRGLRCRTRCEGLAA